MKKAEALFANPLKKESTKFNFFQGRSPALFPGVKLDINDYEMVELLVDLDGVYDAVD